MTQQMTPQPRVGLPVLYTLTAGDATAINQRRNGGSLLGLSVNGVITVAIIGTATAAAPQGNTAVANGSFFSRIVGVAAAATDGTPRFNLQVYLDGNDVYWAQAVGHGSGAGTWRYTYEDQVFT